MAKLSKEQRAYLDGMAHALKIAKTVDIEGLEKEIEFRGLHNVPLNVSSTELIACSREFAKKELYYISTAMASTLTDQLKIPLAKMKEYIRGISQAIPVRCLKPKSTFITTSHL